MARGGQREGAGRKQGTPNRLARTNIDKAEQSGILPLDYMLTVMRNSKAQSSRRDSMAKAAAPYLHPRLATIEHRTPSLDLTLLTDEELEFLSKIKARMEKV